MTTSRQTENAAPGGTCAADGWVPVRMKAVDQPGAGWMIYATFQNGKQGAILQTDALVKQFAYAPWLDPFTPQDFKDMVGRTLAQMAETWNKCHAPNH